MLDQYGESYPELNTLRGAATYLCGIEEDHELCGSDCQYRKARLRAETEPTVYNPMSYIFGPVDANVVIVDEAHKLLDFLRLLINYKFSRTKYHPPAQPDSAWVRSQAKRYTEIACVYRDRKETKKASLNFQSAKRLSRIADLLDSDPDSFVTYFKDGDWYVEPLNVPRDVIEKALGHADKVILMSATLPRSWAEKILGKRKYAYLDSPSPIPAENRKVVFAPGQLKASSHPAEIAQWIKQQLTRYEGNAIVHTTYSMGLSLAEYFPDALVHTKKTKLSTLREFKKRGGLWIAAGASEGIDLAGDCARVNLIPVLPFANNKEPLGAALFERSSYQYYLETAIQFVQQCGRTTRGIEDWSVTVCGDNRLSWLLQKTAKDLPDSFRKAIIWS